MSFRRRCGPQNSVRCRRSQTGLQSGGEEVRFPVGDWHDRSDLGGVARYRKRLRERGEGDPR